MGRIAFVESVRGLDATWVFGVRQENLSIWNYRYSRTDCIIYQVSMRPDGTVRDSAQGYDPACDRGDRN